MCQINLLSMLFYLDQPVGCSWRGCRLGQGGSELAAVIHATGWKPHLRPTLLVQYLERGSSCPRTPGHLWTIPKMFGSCLCSRSLSFGMLESLPRFSATCNWGPVEVMQTGSPRVEKEDMSVAKSRTPLSLVI